jgi:hypothetical protein
MDACIEDFLSDIEHFCSLGARTDALQRLEGILVLYLLLLKQNDEMRLELERKQAQIIRLQEMVFGRSHAVDEAIAQDGCDTSEPSDPDQVDSDNPGQTPKRQENDPKRNATSSRRPSNSPRQGHGRLGADAYTGASVVECHHGTLKAGELCPHCLKGRLSLLDPKQRIVFEGQPPLLATKYLLERLRCSLCGDYFSAQAPVDNTEKYQPSAKAMLAILHCSMGMTYYGLERLQANLGMPVPSSTQCELVEKAAGPAYAILHELIKVAANAKVIGQDDSSIRILELLKENKQSNPKRKGMYISAFYAQGEHKIALFFSGRSHAGENFDKLIAHRDPESPPIIRIADALSANRKHQAEAVDVNCNAHAYRRFDSITSLYPEVCEMIVSLYSHIYDNDRYCKAQGFGDDERLEYHQKHSQQWIDEIDDLVEKTKKEYEPNSAIGKEIEYYVNHRHGLTQFLRVSGAPLDNNFTEAILKVPIKYRKNSLFYLTTYSANYHSCILSVIATAQCNGVNIQHYLSCLIEHEQAVWRSPQNWLPWNYTAALARLTGRQSSDMAA